ncbi:argininosuccinate lyase, partial [Rhizobium ruizarguesonis]
LTVEAPVASHKSFGGTAPSEVRKQLALWRARN